MSSLETPIILSGEKHTSENLRTLRKKVRIWKTVDIFKDQLRELFQITHPNLQQHTHLYQKQCHDFLKRKLHSKKNDGFVGEWVYFPWSGQLVHMLGKKEYTLLRTNRNQNLITKEEQKKLLAAPIGIAGLSIGSAIALNLAYSGISQIIKLAEHDTLETANLNRVWARIDQIGTSKLQITTQQIYEINPSVNLHIYPEGLQKGTLSSFIGGKPKLRIIFDAIDDFEMKVLMRKEAKKQKVPVVMLTNLGDSILIDVERYDTDSKTKLFNGLVPQEFLEKILSGKITEREKNQYAVQIVGTENIPTKAIESVKQIGKTLVGRPQLMSTVTIASGIASFIARKIILGQPVASGRMLIRFDDFLP